MILDIRMNCFRLSSTTELCIQRYLTKKLKNLLNGILIVAIINSFSVTYVVGIEISKLTTSFLILLYTFYFDYSIISMNFKMLKRKLR